MSSIHSTTILAVSYKDTMAFGGDGQVTVSNTIMKHGAIKVRTLLEGKVLAGFAGSAADSFTLFERFEGKLLEMNGHLAKSAVQLAKDWRGDKYLRRLEAMMIVGDKSGMFLLSGMGDVIQPDDGVLAIGSGGNFALAAARGLIRSGNENLTARSIIEISMNIAAEICPFTNNNINIHELSL